MLASFSNYNHPHILSIGALGIASGIPLVLTYSTLTIWLLEYGVTKQMIGLFAFAGLPYSFKFIWAPIIDSYRLPILFRMFGRRRSWLILSQFFLIFSIIKLGSLDPAKNLYLVGLFAIITSFCSATQDIVIDAYRLELLSKEQQAAGISLNIVGYRIGMLISGAGALYLAEHLSWATTYLIMATLIAITMVVAFFMEEPTIDYQETIQKGFHNIWQHNILAPFKDFIQKPQYVKILALVVLFKLCDAFAGQMTNPFLVDMKFSKAEIATIVKSFGFLSILAGSIIGGQMVDRYGLMRSLWWASILQIASNIVFIIQYYLGHDLIFLAVSITIENITAGLGNAIFVIFLSNLCTNHIYTATQYALLSSLSSLGRTVLSTPSGYIVHWLGWPFFFIFSSLLGLPALMLVKKISKQN